MKSEVINITPDLTKEILSRNSTNRRLRNRTVSKYANDMKNGNWHLTGQTITIDKEGQLLDGQHRLSAVIESGVTVPFLVVTDIDRAPTYDCGLVRNMSDRLYLGGIKYSASLMSAAGVAIVRSCMSIVNRGTISVDGKNVSTGDLISWVDKNLDDMEFITQLTHRVTNCSIKGARRASIYATLWAVSKVEENFTRHDIEKFVDIIKTGLAKAEEDVPIVAFRNALLKMEGGGITTDVEIFHRVQYAVRQYLKGSGSAINRYDTRVCYDFSGLKKEEEDK